VSTAEPKFHLISKENRHIVIVDQLKKILLFSLSLSESSHLIHPETRYKNKKPNDKAAIAYTGTNATHIKSFTFSFLKNPSLSPTHSLLFLKKYNKPAIGENITYNQIYIHLVSKTTHNANINIVYTKTKNASKTTFTNKSPIVFILLQSYSFS
jgi:hypothetical protein